MIRMAFSRLTFFHIQQATDRVFLAFGMNMQRHRHAYAVSSLLS
jgi:hypothetical protein